MSKTQTKLQEVTSVVFIRELRATWSYLLTPKFNIFLEELASKVIPNYVPEKATATYKVIALILSEIDDSEFAKHLKLARQKIKNTLNTNQFLEITKYVSDYFEIEPEYILTNTTRAPVRLNSMMILIVIMYREYNINQEEISILINMSKQAVSNNVQKFNKLNKSILEESKTLSDFKNIVQNIKNKTQHVTN